MNRQSFVAALMLMVGVSCTGQSENVLAPKVFKSKMGKSSVTLLDVRTPYEFKTGHLENATNININDPGFEEKSGKLDKAKPVLVYCLAGKRSQKAAEMLRKKGYKVQELEGGIEAWQAAGLPVVK